MATQKRYRCNVSNFAFPCIIAGRQRWLRFYGAMPTEGYYTTDSAVEQRAIETSKRYLRGEIVCVSEVEIADEVMPEVVATQAQAVEVVNGITTVQAAREYLVAEKGAKASELNNREAVLAYAERVGVKFAEL